MSNSYIEIKNISMWYPVKSTLFSINKEKSWIKAVDDVSINIEKGEILGIIGESGCGKSTLGRVLARLEDPTNGDVFIDGDSTKAMMKDDYKGFRKQVQIVFQNPYDSFTPKDTILKILLRTCKIQNIGKSYEERYKIIKETLESGGLRPAEDIMNRFPHQLSGGQLQRISILRAMLLDPKVIIADEPVSMLDVSVRADIINMLLKLNKDSKASIIFISHDISLTRYISGKIAVMYLGKVVEYGDSEVIVNNSKHPYTQVLLSNCASIDPNEVFEKIAINGEPPTPINPGPGCYFAPRCFKAVDECFAKYPAIHDLDNSHYVACDRLEND